MARRIEVRTPSRIDLAGGWTDVPTYCEKMTGEVVNIAINHYVRCEMEIDNQRKISLSYTTDMPTGSGLGTSGAMNVGFISTIANQSQLPLETAEIAYQFEALLGNTGGRQDQWASALGGVNHLTFSGEAVSVKPLKVSAEFADWLEQHIMLFNSHITHVSGELHKSVWQRYLDGDQEIKNGLNTIRKAGLLMAEGIAKESIVDVVDAMRLNSAGVDILGLELHQPFRDLLDQQIADGTVRAWKAMGAGGGGVVGAIIADTQYTSKLIDALNAYGWSHIPWRIDYDGVVRTEINL
ncbi:MAG TPA: hypothetical protein HA354_02835 [Candidatus Poseidoniaceae archaeon]|mgnify:FL=1|nr:hypothetical protein [Euryarchaeota archaeon]DAC58958.1 MAG TPA: hypothetical protein D7I07_02815 [Candidatus Poseidoniales archaeon]HII37416.1 hypothetical protein [Candidatus Poseidoniaceae archaeon]